MSNTVRIRQFGDAAGIETYSFTAHVGSEELTFTLKQTQGIDFRFACDSLEIDRTGAFTAVTVTPDPHAEVMLTDGPPLVSFVVDSGEQGVFLAAVFLWAWFFHRIFATRPV